MKKKGIAQERREAKAEKEQVEIYERMLQGQGSNSSLIFNWSEIPLFSIAKFI